MLKHFSQGIPHVSQVQVYVIFPPLRLLKQFTTWRRFNRKRLAVFSDTCREGAGKA